jgi:adenosylcobinamide-GDP ribazoletransferase
MNSLRQALALFTIAPVANGAELTRSEAVRALRWLPFVGAVVGALAGLPLAAVEAWSPGARLTGAVLSICVLVLLSGGLHVDGLADVADGIGSRAPAARALEIMRQSDIGPFGVVSVVLVLLLDVGSTAALGGCAWTPVAALASAGAIGRLVAVVAAHRRIPSARESGFGNFVASSVSSPVLALEGLAVVAGVAGVAAAVNASIVTWVVAALVGTTVGLSLLAYLVRRLGGVTGDVFGALVEVGTAVVLAGLALG